MNIISKRKIIISLLLIVMIVTAVSPVFAIVAKETDERPTPIITFFREAFSKAKSFKDMIVSFFKNIFEKFKNLPFLKRIFKPEQINTEKYAGDEIIVSGELNKMPPMENNNCGNLTVDFKDEFLAKNRVVSIDYLFNETDYKTYSLEKVEKQVKINDIYYGETNIIKILTEDIETREKKVLELNVVPEIVC